MHFNFEIVKKHPYAIGGSLIAVFLLIYLYRKHAASASESSSTPSTVVSSPTDTAPNNTQIALAGIAAQTSQVQTAASLQASLAQTAASVAENKQNNRTAVLQSEIQGQTAIGQTEIQTAGATDVAQIAANGAVAVQNAKNQVQLAQIAEQESFYKTLTKTGHLGGSSTGVAQVLSAVYGQGPQAIAANEPSAVANSPANIISSVGNVAGKIFSGLF